jgi:hypothetical protein
MIKTSYIKQLSNGEYRVYSKSGKNLGTYTSKSEAEDRLKEVEMFKHMKDRKKSFDNILNIIKESNEPEVTSTFSSVMRDINSDNTESAINFMRSFKESFDKGLIEAIEEPDSAALMQAMNDTDYSVFDVRSYNNKNMVKMAQTILDMKEPKLAGRTIANMIKHLLNKIEGEDHHAIMQVLRKRILRLNEREIASKKTPGSASLGQSIAFIKNMLSGKDPSYIRNVLQSVSENLR